MLDPSIPNGVIFDPKPTDFVSGDGNLGSLPARNWVPNNNWLSYTPKGERQSGNGFDTNDCTGFALTNSCECQFKYMRLNNLVSVDNLAWLSQNGYLDENGDCNFSDRALGAMAGTSSKGNSLNTVAQTARDGGLIPESKWPSVFTNYADYYKLPPQELLDLGQEFKKRFTISYEYVPSGANPDDMTGAPFYSALATCSGWQFDNPVKWCGITTTNHAIVELKQNPYSIFDSYTTNGSFIKNLGAGYIIPFKYRVYLAQSEDQPINSKSMYLANDHGTIYEISGNKDQRKKGIADLESLGTYGDEPQIPMDTSHIPEYQVMKKAPDYATTGNFIIVKK